jgi:hypothetical protein
MYRIWGNMIQRCENPKNPRFERYGGRGITVCKRWRESFEDYLEDIQTLGEQPSPDHTLDRIDNDGPYEISNMRYATKAEQAKNRSNARWIDHPDGRRMQLKDWADAYGIDIRLLHKRLGKGMPIAKALSLSTKRT